MVYPLLKSNIEIQAI